MALRWSWPVRPRAWLGSAATVRAACACGRCACGWCGKRDWGGRSVCEASVAGACAVEADDVRGGCEWGGRSVYKVGARHRFCCL